MKSSPHPQPGIRARSFCPKRPLAVAILVALCPGAATAAEDFPARPMRMLVVATAGGPADFVGRLAAQYLSEFWGQQIVIDNRPGAAGTIATETVVRSNPDGYTMLLGATSTFSIVPSVVEKLSYNIERDLSLTGLLAIAPHVIAIREGVPAKSLKELLALTRAQPGKFSFASGGTGTIVHMSGELFRQQAALDLLHVPFKGGAQAAIGLLAGEADILVNDLQTIQPHMKSGRMRVLAVANPKRLAPLPDVPTFAELGMPGMLSSTWWGIAISSKAPAAVKNRYAATQAKVLARPDYIERLAALAMEPLVLTPEQSQAFIRAETEKWRKVVTLGKIKLE
jgi:tripartite-type tricarboxylate transporter receptor subunit TctC